MDRRDMRHCWFESFDEKSMTFTIMDWDETIPAKFEVCDLCDGKGKHVNPSIDSHGISAEEFAEDPDFAEDYFRGNYDVPCAQCHGQRVSAEPDYDRMSADFRVRVESYINDYYDYQRECDYERRMGC